MNMTDVVELCEQIGVAPQPGPLGVQIGTTGWRLESGGGIAGHLNAWWLRIIPGAYSRGAPYENAKPIGPLFTRTQIESALRAQWRSLLKNRDAAGKDYR